MLLTKKKKKLFLLITKKTVIARKIIFFRKHKYFNFFLMLPIRFRYIEPFLRNYDLKKRLQKF